MPACESHRKPGDQKKPGCAATRFCTPKNGSVDYRKPHDGVGVMRLMGGRVHRLAAQNPNAVRRGFVIMSGTHLCAAYPAAVQRHSFFEDFL